jgi:hypothetical protein
VFKPGGDPSLFLYTGLFIPLSTCIGEPTVSYTKK